MSMEGIGPCFNENEAAQRLRVSRITLMRARLRGELSCFRIGTRVVYAESHLLDYLAAVERKRSASSIAAAALARESRAGVSGYRSQIAD